MDFVINAGVIALQGAHTDFIKYYSQEIIIIVVEMVLLLNKKEVIINKVNVLTM